MMKQIRKARKNNIEKLLTLASLLFIISAQIMGACKVKQKRMHHENVNNSYLWQITTH